MGKDKGEKTPKDKSAKKEKKDKSAKKEKAAAEEQPVAAAAEVVATKSALAPIAKPLADDKLSKKALKLAKKAAKRKQIKRGVKEVIKAIRKKAKGVCLIAGDISPIDVITPLPVLCEDNDVPYIYVPSKEELGAAGLTKRPTSCMLILPKPLKGAAPSDDEAKEFAEAYAEVEKKVKAAQIIF
ncbi:H ACA ribonucleo complex subunit 2 [Chlorella sorokiniana]|jgi:H/ACA ribonucleoprotein complex subunit 2|uniref:H/ACA ribonucleoprotein complex subunit 2 n=1 Tax=Chlorella sorokiniana TaxID=3076 RepID=A0A2P6TBR3_CHLSO|nr:H ACA ribonucleo complex subunit 2 [Chlorella sorokiniana]|eukprot:PRW18324.1 H ACA ribonucleo complex subunit 2 [Chlorella sorokiniana]